MCSAENSSGVLLLKVRMHCLGSRFTGAFPELSRPQPIGYYSVNADQEFEDNASNASYFRLPAPDTLPLNLNAGIEHVQRKKPTPEFHCMRHLCSYIYKHQGQLLLKSTNGQMKLNNEFVTFRGILRLIMCTVYEKAKDYRLIVRRLNGTIYIAREETGAERIEQEQMTERQLNMCSWGFKFEQYCTSETPTVPPKTDVPVNEATQFACIYRCTLNRMNLLYGAEMDAMKSDKLVDLKDAKQLSSVKFVELKTTGHHLNRNQQRTFDRCKSLKWWCQSYLVGIDTIIAGLRNHEGLLLNIQEYNVSDLYRHKPWSPSAVVTFLSNFLHEVKCLMNYVDSDDAVVRLDFIAQRHQVYYTVLKEADRPKILPDWYCQMMRGESD